MLSIDNLLSQAASQTGLSDFGAPTFMEGLQKLLDAVDNEAQLSSNGQRVFHQLLINNLINRLEIQDWYQRHPDIDEQEIKQPLIGLGLPRTGSTVFFQMLAMDPAVRTIRTWEGTKPCPPPIAGQEEDPRVRAAVKSMAQRDHENPKLKAMLPSSATSALECGIIMALDFKSNFYSAMLDIPSYSQWLQNEADMTSAYQYLKQSLKLLQWRCPPTRWRLKSPPHSMFIQALNKVFPDARFWMTHRDIGKVIPSVCDLYAENRKRYSDHIDKLSLGRFNIEFWQEALQRMLSFRDMGNESRFIDIYFDEFQADPIPSLQRLYAFMDEPFTEETAARVLAWREDTPKGKHGTHKYDAADYGINLEDLRLTFSLYHQRFNV